MWDDPVCTAATDQARFFPYDDACTHLNTQSYTLVYMTIFFYCGVISKALHAFVQVQIKPIKTKVKAGN